MTTLEIGDTVIFLHSNDYYVRGGLEDFHLYESSIIINEENGYDVINIENPWFNINKPGSKKIIFSVDKNETEKERRFFIHLIDYKSSYHTIISVNQSAD